MLFRSLPLLYRYLKTRKADTDGTRILTILAIVLFVIDGTCVGLLTLGIRG